MSIVIHERNVKRFAYHMCINAKQCDKLMLLKQVTWRVDRACIIMKWYIFPTDVAKQIMCFLGNETETECSKSYAANHIKRVKQMKEFKLESEQWVWIYSRIEQLGHQVWLVKMLDDCKELLLKLASEMNPPTTNFPWL